MEPSAVAASDVLTLGDAGTDGVAGSSSPVGSGSELDEHAPSTSTTVEIMMTSDFTTLS
jgi:hypothetical protein